jgi:hypothetical protein
VASVAASPGPPRVGVGGGARAPLVLSSAFKDKPPPSLTCHLCARDFGTASLGIHIKTCEKKWERKQRELPEVCARAGGLPAKLGCKDGGRGSWFRKGPGQCVSCGMMGIVLHRAHENAHKCCAHIRVQ